MSKDKQASQVEPQVFTVVASTGPNGVNNSMDSKAWKISHPIQYSIEGLMDMPSVVRRAFAKGATIEVQREAREAWEQAGHTVDNSTPAEWEAHLTSFLSEPITADVLDEWVPEPKQQKSAKVDKQATKGLAKAEGMILLAYNNGNGLGQIAGALQVQVSMIVGVLVKHKARIREQDKAIVAAVQAAEAMVK